MWAQTNIELTFSVHVINIVLTPFTCSLNNQPSELILFFIPAYIPAPPQLSEE